MGAMIYCELYTNNECNQFWACSRSLSIYDIRMNVTERVVKPFMAALTVLVEVTLNIIFRYPTYGIPNTNESTSVMLLSFSIYDFSGGFHSTNRRMPKYGYKCITDWVRPMFLA